jgi:hypothetical protein
MGGIRGACGPDRWGGCDPNPERRMLTFVGAGTGRVADPTNLDITPKKGNPIWGVDTYIKDRKPLVDPAKAMEDLLSSNRNSD